MRIDRHPDVAMSGRMLINTSYRDLPVGIGVYTKNLLEALPEAGRVAVPARLLTATRWRHLAKRGLEAGMAAIPSPVIHPLWTLDASSRHVMAPLDVVLYGDTSAPERRVMRLAARRARGLITLSQHSADLVEAEVGRELTIAPPFSEPEWYAEPTPTPTGPAAGRIRIAYWGGFAPRKGFPAFLESLGRSELADQVEVVTTGDWPRGGPVNVRSSGHLSTADLVRLVDSCHVSVYPSSEEGYGLPVAEALLRQRPVLCSPLAVYSEFATGSGVFPVLDWSDPEEVATVLMKALQDPLSRDEALRSPHRVDAVRAMRTALLTVLSA